jgi:hypothetical protein
MADVEVKILKQDYDLEECKNVGVCDQSIEAVDFKRYDRPLEEAKVILRDFINQ